MRKKIILLFVVITLSITPCFANMPVIDVTAIAQAVTSYVQTIKEWKTQLKQWKSEFDRLQKASEDLASGDFTTILKGVASLTKQMSTWNLSSTLFEDDTLDRALNATGDGTYSLLNIMNDSEMFTKYSEYWLKQVEKQINSWSKEWDEVQNQGNDITQTIGGVGVTGSNATEMATRVLDLITKTLLYGGDVAGEIGDTINGFADAFNISPNEAYDMYKEIQEDTIKNSTNNKARSTKEIGELINDTADELAEAKEELSNINAEEQNNAYQKALYKVEQLEEKMTSYEKLLEWSRGMDSALKKIRDADTDYENAQAVKAAEKVVEQTGDNISTAQFQSAQQESNRVKNSVSSMPNSPVQGASSN